MPGAIATALWLMLPLVVAGALHMATVKRNWLAPLARPVHARALGRNKTWRGFVVMPLATVLGVYATLAFQGLIAARIPVDLRVVPPVALGLALGMAYMLAELPNSWVKRRLGIPPGKRPQHNRFWFTLVDQADSAVGCMFVYAWLLEVPMAPLIWFVVLGPAVHLVVNVSLYGAGLRSEVA